VLEGFWFNSAPGAGETRVLLEPEGVGGKVAFGRAHLVDPSRNKLP